MELNKCLEDNNSQIEKLISVLSNDKGLLFSTLFDKLRKFLESLFIQIYNHSNQNQLFCNDKENIDTATKFVLENNKYKKIMPLFDSYQVSSSHFGHGYDGYERLMYWFQIKLIELKQFMKDDLEINILGNIESIIAQQNIDLHEYYSNIHEKVFDFRNLELKEEFSDRFYVEKIKPVFINKDLFYEITVFNWRNSQAKNNKKIFFSKELIPDNYSVQLRWYEEKIQFFNNESSINIVTKWMFRIRMCELEHFAKLLNLNISFGNTHEFEQIMEYLTINNLNLFDVVSLSDEEYDILNTKIHKNKRISLSFFNFLNRCREIIKNNEFGKNIISYLLFKMNNDVIKSQLSYWPNERAPLLNISSSANSFERMPYARSLIAHNPKLTDLLKCISPKNRSHELLFRRIETYTEYSSKLYTSIDELGKDIPIKLLVSKFNSSFSTEYDDKKIKFTDKRDYIYIQKYQTVILKLINKLIELSKEKGEEYKELSKKYLLNKNNIRTKKIKIIKNLFLNSRIAIITGDPGTGKTTIINNIAEIFKDYKKLFLAVTNNAVENLRLKILDRNNASFSTIAKNINQYNQNGKIEVDLLVVDEASTISNKEMLEILEKNKFKFLLIVGDVKQIPSIRFGNWFRFINEYFKENIYVLDDQFRTKDKGLKKVWYSAKKDFNFFFENLTKYKINHKLKDFIFEKNLNEIILTQNYNGIYGINNINETMQYNNFNEAFIWKSEKFKIGDPIVFNQSSRFPNTFYNNLTGTIKNIVLTENKINFEIEINQSLDKNNLDPGISFVSEKDNKTTVTISAIKHEDYDKDVSANESQIPFQISYAMSIHRAQGLEFDSVRLVLTEENKELITKEIFYTAITRAKTKLGIYWSKETEKFILESFDNKKYKDTDEFKILKGLIEKQNKDN
ncbi:hypothetical protein CJJ23_02355 [Mycoplasmopsis agassizii]|uniref:UvrD-like helicase C-terminal domain-containing protein n=1 Tax=Mycoplasmopsis agassizii TaxID=33922 RepID=A0A269TJJ9_9BACT|nr:AAA family ATPase [Mycoplasmopsis agassizii]PAK21360.1 hypothetical protein CJJ23_02355 [Mycoplasmopsis agassizii]